MIADTQQISDLHEISGAAICKRSGRSMRTLWRHVVLGHIEPGLKRPGVAGHFWTKAQVNRYLRKLGMRDQCFE